MTAMQSDDPLSAHASRHGASETDAAPADPWHVQPHVPAVFESVTPLPLAEDTPRPPFPTDVFPLWLRSYVDMVSWTTQTPSDFAAVMALAVLSSCIGGQVVVAPRSNWHEPLCVFVVVIANPGERKSAVLRHLLDPVIAWQRSVNDEVRETVIRQEIEREALEGQLQALKRKAASEGDAAVRSAQELAIRLHHMEQARYIQIVASDITPERIITTMARQLGAAAIISSEGEIFGILTGRYGQRGNVNIDPLLKGHAGDPIAYDRQDGSSIFIPRPSLTLGLMVQPHAMDAVIRDPFLSGRGFLARLLYSRPISMVGRRMVRVVAPMDQWQAALHDYTAMVHHLLDIFRKRLAYAADIPPPYTLMFTDEAEVEIARFELQIESRMGRHGDLNTIVAWASKLCGATARLAGLLHIADHGSDALERPITVDVWRRAERLAHYFIAHALASLRMDAYDDVRPVAQGVVDEIRRQRIDRLSRTDIYRYCPQPWRTVEHIDRVVRILIEYGYLAEAQPVSGQRGRPPTNYLVNPAVHADETTSFFTAHHATPMTRTHVIADGSRLPLPLPVPAIDDVYAILRRVRAWDPHAYIRLHKTEVTLETSRSDPPPDDVMHDLRTIAHVIFVTLCHTRHPSRADFENALRQIQSVSAPKAYSAAAASAHA